MKKSLILSGFLAVVAISGIAWAALIEKSVETFQPIIVTLPNTATTVCVNNQSFATPIKYSRSEVCWKANWTATSELAYVDTQDRGEDEVNHGWPIVGSEKECHDWDANIPLCFWLADGVVGSREIRVLGAK